MLLFIIGPHLAHAYANGKITLDVLTPKPGAYVPNANLFVSATVDAKHSFVSANKVDVFLDGFLINGILKINKNKMSFLYPATISSGKHKLRVEVKLKGVNQPLRGTWEFYAGKKDYINHGKDTVKSYEDFQLTGIVSVDNRSELLSGSGKDLRQEPNATRTVNIDATARYKGIEIPVRVFATNNNNPALQSMNYFQVGLRTRWLELEAGDLNISFDKLVLSGIRLTGAGIKLKNHLTSIKVYYGDMARPIDGALRVYTPGTGILPSNLVNDSQYVETGVYRRKVVAGRLELCSPKDEIRLCASVFKAKDDVSSIKYGLAPKDNVAAGTDITLRFFHRRITIQSGLAVSVLTNDISSGAISKHILDSTYHVNAPVDPQKYERIIILNASTQPAQLSASFDNMASYVSLNVTNKFQTFTADYKNFGAIYYSLGNPFMLSNYKGLNAQEKISMLKKRVSFSVGYRDYSNNLNGASDVKVHTTGLNGNLFLNPGTKWPTFMFNYINQNRTGTSELVSRPGINDEFSNYMVNINYNSSFWKLRHLFRFMLNISDRTDHVNQQNQFSASNFMFGIGEHLTNGLNVNADIGKAVITSQYGGTLSDITIYNFSLDWQLKPQKYFAGLSVSNTTTMNTLYANQAYRLSFTGKFGYKFYKGMGIDVEAGYQPYIDQVNEQNSYSELFGYIRYTYDLGRIFSHENNPVENNDKLKHKTIK